MPCCPCPPSQSLPKHCSSLRLIALRISAFQRPAGLVIRSAFRVEYRLPIVVAHMALGAQADRVAGLLIGPPCLPVRQPLS